ncbi:MAG: cation:proton antiporter [Burkholderiaceae bacterium]
MQTWFLLIGALLVAMAFNSRLVQRLPLSPAMLYLGVGYAMGPGGTGLLNAEILRDASAIEMAAEIAVLVTLFAVGLRLQTPRQSWHIAARLASFGMIVTIAVTALAAHLLLGLPALMAFLLAAILAPTDPVLASDVQIREPGERDAVRLSLTAEGGLNDGAAFPAVLLALGLLGVHSIGPFGARWIAVDLLWSVAGGLGIGWACGRVVARLLVRLRRAGQPLEFEEFLVLGTIALTYGLALTLHTYGFLAVFAAGIAVAHGIRGVRDVADKSKSPTTLSERLLVWSGQGERLIEVALVILLGALAGSVNWSWPVVAFAMVLMLIARPLAVYMTVRGADAPPEQRRLIAWFGIRGIGSLYYLAFALGKGVENSYAEAIANAALAAIVLSIVVHGISATPLMQRHEEHVARGDTP